MRARVIGSSLSSVIVSRILRDLGFEVDRKRCNCNTEFAPHGEPYSELAVGLGISGYSGDEISESRSPVDATVLCEHGGSSKCVDQLLARPTGPEIRCVIRGYPRDHPKANEAWTEDSVMADAGVFRPDPEGKLRWNPIPLASVFAAVNAALLVVMALIARERYGHGDEIEVSLFEALFSVMGPGSFLGQQPLSSDIWGAGMYTARDGRALQMNTLSPRFTPRLRAALGNPIWWREEYSDRLTLATDRELRAQFISNLQAEFLKRDAEDWVTVLNSWKLPATLIQSFEEWADRSEALESDALSNSHGGGSKPRPGKFINLRVSSKGGSKAFPRPGIDSLPLSGIKVLDASTVLAGPLSGRILAEFGAEVTKINDPEDPPQGIIQHHDVNRLKRSILVDPHLPEGKELIEYWSSIADVVLHNITPGSEHSLGLSEPLLREVNPDHVYASLSAYGRRGPWSSRRGYESQAQAASGIMVDYGLGNPLKQPLLINDYGTGLMTALGIATGILLRMRTGGGSTVETSLVHTASFLQWLASFRVSTRRARRSQRFGPSLSQRLYEASDDWVFVSGDSGDEEQLLELLGLGPESQERDVEEVIGRMSCRELATLLQEGGLLVVKARLPTELLVDDWVWRKGLLVTVDTDSEGSFVTAGNPGVALWLRRKLGTNSVSPITFSDAQEAFGLW